MKIYHKPTIYRTLIIISLLCTVITKHSEAQNITGYFLLDSIQQKGLKFTHIKCADETYKAELFNVFYPGDSTRLTLFTAFKPFYNGAFLHSENNRLKKIHIKYFSKSESIFRDQPGCPNILFDRL